MKKDNVIELIQPGEFKDHLTEVLRQGAQSLVLQAVEAEFAAFLDNHSDEKLEDGRKRLCCVNKKEQTNIEKMTIYVT